MLRWFEAQSLDEPDEMLLKVAHGNWSIGRRYRYQGKGDYQHGRLRRILRNWASEVKNQRSKFAHCDWYTLNDNRDHSGLQGRWQSLCSTAIDLLDDVR